MRQRTNCWLGCKAALLLLSPVLLFIVVLLCVALQDSNLLLEPFHFLLQSLELRNIAGKVIPAQDLKGCQHPVDHLADLGAEALKR